MTFLAPNYPWRTREIGATHGLRLTLDLHVDDYLGMAASDVGAKLVIHDGREYGSPLEDGFTIRAGQRTLVAVKMTRFERLPAPYETNCIGEFPVLYRNFSTPNVRYTVDECLSACERRQVWLECGCYEYYNIVGMERFVNNTSTASDVFGGAGGCVYEKDSSC